MNDIITNNITQSKAALGALRQVIDPEIGLNIVDLGLIYQIDFNEDTKEIFISMTLTTQFCPMGETIRDGAISAMEAAFPNHRIHLELVFSPAWNAERISEEGKEYLNH